jgi:zinc transport system ATP-binding protein
VLLGALEPAAGSVRLLGRPPALVQDRGRIGYVPQRPSLAPDVPATVREIVATGRLAHRGWLRRLTGDDERAIDHALASEEHGAGVLLVSHELSAVADVIDRVVVLKRRVLFDGPPAKLVAEGVSLGVHAADLPLWLEDLR